MAAALAGHLRCYECQVRFARWLQHIFWWRRERSVLTGQLNLACDVLSRFYWRFVMRAPLALALMLALMLGGGVLAGSKTCINGKCFTCEGSQSCTNETCTCNGVPMRPDNEPQSAPANDTLIMTFINKSSSPAIYYAFYAKDRSMSWPGVGADVKAGISQPGVSKTYWVDHSGDQQVAYSLQCVRGQIICWAAWHDGNLRDGAGGWGAGAFYSVDCKDCCYQCGSKPETQLLN